MIRKHKTSKKHKTNKKHRTNKKHKTSKKIIGKKTNQNKVYKQDGSSFMNNIAGNLFSNTEPQPNTVNFPQKDIITIIYNRDTPKTIIINNTSPDILYKSSLVQTVPNIQMKDYDNHYLLVIILPGIKPELLWTIEINDGAKIKSILDYTLPKFTVGFNFKIIFKLHKYNNNVKDTFNVVNNLAKDRYAVFNELNNYLTNNNMLNSAFFKEINIVQDEGQDISQLLNYLAK